MQNKIILLCFIALCTVSCVQKASKKIVKINLTINGKKDVQTVGIRGNGKPLSWDKDLVMQELVKDSLYTATTSIRTGFKFGEIKFTVNGEWELQNEPSRKIVFSTTSDTTIYNASFDKN